MVKEACPRKWRKIQERSHVLWLGVWTFILKNWNRKLSKLILHVWALIVADLKSRCAFAFSFLWTWGLTALCFLLSSYICSFCLESYEHRYSHTIFPNTIFTFTMNFFKNRKEITFEKEINFAPLLLSHQKLHKCTKEGGGGFQKWLHCDICPWCITESVSLPCDRGRVMRGTEEAEAEVGGSREVRSCPYRALQDCRLLLQWDGKPLEGSE